MGLQVIVRCENEHEVIKYLKGVVDSCEGFFIDKNLFGLSIPTNILDLVGEDNIWVALQRFDVYDLWSGNWHYKKSSI
ncbi:hypothetical protein HUN33_19235 [Acinetobacter bereziniae]|jgi:hypothetical protein|uniref:hypothetical protein n=1 Tax=Acinetobacter bereziniae TaxID=106648 RepID=UPI00157FFDB8|nr:hypothetical protein [Acinetobacter bereziniae]NUF64379.1 hypothetical protein [Acinetobacter bereziniae]NUG08799.1 hypothetical protein [Acinetobacter bereziniae]NUG65312.1 hypothetical protein [Acinetobacter bereziniae]NUG70883.1 hypothetical protein [Acinetobacter bereziniae]NUG82140.1 hypothetical protein [Acinetobacter bereziniae]